MAKLKPGAAIRAFRDRQKPKAMTLEKLAKKLRMTRSNLSRIERGLQPIPREHLEKLVMLGVPAALLAPDLAKCFKKNTAARSRARAA